MKIPNAETAVIPREKITGYLLSFSHPVGKAKAKSFRAQGYSDENAPIFGEGLRRVAALGRVAEEENTAYGITYIAEG